MPQGRLLLLEEEWRKRSRNVHAAAGASLGTTAVEQQMMNLVTPGQQNHQKHGSGEHDWVTIFLQVSHQ